MSEIAPEGQLWNLLRGALAARALGLDADLRLAEALSTGPRTVAELAAETDADPGTLHRLLRALASDGVFAEEEAGVCTPSREAASETKRSGRPCSPRAASSRCASRTG